MAERAKFESVDDYLAALTPERRVGIDELRATVRKALPEEAVEVLSYQIIGYRVGKGRPVVWIAAFPDHFSLYPFTDEVRAALGPEVEPYLSGKGTIRLPADRPLPLEMVRRVTEILLERSRTG
jgi:uncharacterized protein YdhG (YjbR/CyaY superfamily)